MKGAGCLFVMFLVTLALGLGGLYALRQYRPEILKPDPHRPPRITPREEPPNKPPAPDPDHYKQWVDSLREFHREESGGSYRLTFGFIDHNGVTHHVTCSISKSDYETESASYGYVESDIKKQIDRRLQPILDTEVKRRGIQEYFTVKARDGGGYNWDSHYPAGISDSDYKDALTRIDAMTAYLEAEYRRIGNEIKADLYKERGFLYKDRFITIDHGGMVLRSQLPLSDCYGALRREAHGYNERQYLGLYLAFFQEIRYEVPPDEVNGKKTLGLYVPTEVLVNDHGDCDSKSLAFSAMMRAMLKPVLVIDLPDHVLVGVETRPGPGQAYVRVGNRYFVLCEVAGPGKLAPGNEGSKPSVTGYFDYTLIDPVSADFPHGSSTRSASR